MRLVTIVMMILTVIIVLEVIIILVRCDGVEGRLV